MRWIFVAEVVSTTRWDTARVTESGHIETVWTQRCILQRNAVCNAQHDDNDKLNAD